MRYVFSSGNRTFLNYMRKYHYNSNKDVVKACKENINKITKNDIVALAFAWWYHDWEKENILRLVKQHPPSNFEFADGKEGEKYRKNLKEKGQLTRFDLIDIESDKT